MNLLEKLKESRDIFEGMIDMCKARGNDLENLQVSQHGLGNGKELSQLQDRSNALDRVMCTCITLRKQVLLDSRRFVEQEWNKNWERYVAVKQARLEAGNFETERAEQLEEIIEQIDKSQFVPARNGLVREVEASKERAKSIHDKIKESFEELKGQDENVLLSYRDQLPELRENLANSEAEAAALGVAHD
jgi:hypothetical protein